MYRRILSSWRRALLISVVAVLIVGSGVFLVGSQIDEPFVQIKSGSDIEFTIDKNNNPSVFAYFEVFSPNSGVHPYPFFWLTEDAKMFTRGPFSIDISHKSGAPGREALFLKGSSDNVDVGVMVNRSRFFIWSTLTNDRADLIIRNLQATGTKSAVVATESYGSRALYSVEAPEVWVEDYGSGQLVNGETRIDLDSIFLETVTIDAQHPMKVFIQLTAEANPVYVTKGETYFIVKELNGGKSMATFDYRVVAKRKGFEAIRLEATSLGQK